MIRRHIVTAAFLTAMAVGATAAQHGRSDDDKALRVGHYRTYAWAAGMPFGERSCDAQIVGSIERELTLKQLTRSTDTPADLLVSYHVRVDRPVQVVALASGWGPHAAHGGGSAWP